MTYTLCQFLVFKLWVTCFLATAFPATCFQIDEMSRDVPESSTHPPRDALICGPNSVLMFLTICGTEVDDEDISNIDVGDKGATLLQLRDACNALGQPTEVRQLAPSQFKNLGPPVILHVDSGNIQHFHVMYGVASGGDLKVLDGTTGEKMVAKAEKLDGFYSGYVLITRRDWLMSTGILRFAWGLIGASALLGVLLLTGFFRSRSSTSKSGDME